MEPITPFNELAKALHSQMERTAILLGEVPSMDPSAFHAMHQRYLQLMAQVAGLLLEAQLYHQYMITYRQHAHTFETLEASERRMSEALQMWRQATRSPFGSTAAGRVA